MTKEISFCLKVDDAPSLPGAYAMAIELEAPMTKNTEGAAGDLAADLAALRQDVARPAKRWASWCTIRWPTRRKTFAR